MQETHTLVPGAPPSPPLAWLWAGKWGLWPRRGANYNLKGSLEAEGPKEAPHLDVPSGGGIYTKTVQDERFR